MKQSINHIPIFLRILVEYKKNNTMNSFGRLFRIHIFGESHGPAVGIIIDGCPAGIPLSVDDFQYDIQRRKPTKKAGTPRTESDTPVIQSGVFNNHTTGAPITIFFVNHDIKSNDYNGFQQQPRPGHADFVASKKFNGFEDYRGGGHFSGRLTLCLVAAGVIAKKIIQKNDKGINIHVQSKVISVGGCTNVEEGIQKAIDANDSVGGIVECKVNGIPVGLGEPFFDSVESALSHIVFSIPAIKGIEFGKGFAAASMFGSEHNDVFIDVQGTTKTNHSGGISGGLTNGNEMVFRISVKPTSSTPQSQETIHLSTGKIETLEIAGRHDLCIALRVPVVLEAVTAIVLADFILMS